MNTSTQPNIDIIDVIYEDKYSIAINKPNNFLIHHSHYARNIQEPTLLDRLNDQLGYPTFPVHRLDRKTSGILLLAKDKKDIALFQELFITNKILKTYFAITRGLAPDEGKIDSPVKNDDTGKYKDAITYFENLQQIELDIPVKPYDQSRYSLLKLTPKTGRMHQLRRHLNKISHPIIGDYKYGDRFHNRMFETEFNCIYMFLHAFQLDFTHPITNEKLQLRANFPADWKTLFKQFNWKLNENR